MRIIADQNIPLLADIIPQEFDLLLVSGRDLTNKFLKENPAEALIVRSVTHVGRSLLENTTINFVGTATAGIDHIDTDYLSKNDISFVSAPGSNANSVAEYVVYSILKWSLENDIDLKSSKIGIIGFGNVGKLVAHYASRLGITVLVNDPPLKDDNIIFPESVQYAELDELLSVSDIITNHVPLTYEGEYKTFSLISENEFSKIRPNSLILHTSRGGVIDELSLLPNISRVTYITDVFSGEPLLNPEVVASSNLATPHIAGYSLDAKLKGSKMIVKSLSQKYGFNADFTKIDSMLRRPYEELDFNDIKSLHKLLKNRRKLDLTDSKLRESMILPDDERVKFFDIIRKDYQNYRETLYPEYQ